METRAQITDLDLESGRSIEAILQRKKDVASLVVRQDHAHTVSVVHCSGHSFGHRNGNTHRHRISRIPATQRLTCWWDSQTSPSKDQVVHYVAEGNSMRAQKQPFILMRTTVQGRAYVALTKPTAQKSLVPL
jgi:hypothetical protein